jgi:hypothetical protein
MKIKILLIILSILLVTIYGFYQLSSSYLVFEDMKDDQIVQGTDYVPSFQKVEVTLSNGSPLKTTEIYLTNQRTHTRFSVLARFVFGQSLGETICYQCISVIHSHEHTYLITRADNGGSGGYYIHSIFEVVDNRLIDKGSYLSCGNAYLRDNRVTFPMHKTGCPELFTDMRRYAWEYESFDLSKY